MKNRPQTHLFICLFNLPSVFLFVLTALLISGCGAESDSEAVHTNDSPAASTDQWQFNSPQAFIDYVASFDDDAARLGLFDKMYGRSREELWTIKYHRAAAQAELEYRTALIEQFGEAATPIIGPTMQLVSLPTSAQQVTTAPHGDTRMFITFDDANGQEHVIVLARIRGLWTPHATSITNGNDVTTTWCNSKQGEYTARIKYYRDVAANIHQGKYTTAQQAQHALDQLMAGPPPPRGSVQVD